MKVVKLEAQLCHVDFSFLLGDGRTIRVRHVLGDIGRIESRVTPLAPDVEAGSGGRGSGQGARRGNARRMWEYNDRGMQRDRNSRCDDEALTSCRPVCGEHGNITAAEREVLTSAFTGLVVVSVNLRRRRIRAVARIRARLIVVRVDLRRRRYGTLQVGIRLPMYRPFRIGRGACRKRLYSEIVEVELELVHRSGKVNERERKEAQIDFAGTPQWSTRLLALREYRAGQTQRDGSGR